MAAATLPAQHTLTPAGPVVVRLGQGTELLGPYHGSAYTEAQYLLRRSDGQIIQVTRLLYLVAESLDGRRDASQVAGQVSQRFGRPVSATNIEYLVEHKLQPLGVLAPDHGPDTLKRANPLLALRMRTRMVPERFHRGISWALRPMFWPPIVVAVVAGFVAVDAWLIATGQSGHIGRSTVQVILHPDLLLLVTVMTAAGGAFHEIGHASAARYGGARPGVMGVGIYLMMPVFYTDVSDSYRLNRTGRLRTDLGGIYFNLITIVAAGVAYRATGYQPLLIFIVVTQLEVCYQFLPFVRMDGYYVVSDLIGVPNLFAFVGPVLAGLFGRTSRAGQTRLSLIKRPARIAIRVWVFLTVPLLALNVAVIAYFAPRVFPTAWTSARIQARALTVAVHAADPVAALSRLTQLVLLAVPTAGTLYMVVMLIRRIGPPVARWTTTRIARLARRTGHQLGRPPGAAIALAGAITAVVVLAQPLPLGQHHPNASHTTTASALHVDPTTATPAGPTALPAPPAVIPTPQAADHTPPALVPTPPALIPAVPSPTAAVPTPAAPLVTPRPAVRIATPVRMSSSTPASGSGRQPVRAWSVAAPGPALRVSPGRQLTASTATAVRTPRPVPALSPRHPTSHITTRHVDIDTDAPISRPPVTHPAPAHPAPTHPALTHPALTHWAVTHSLHHVVPSHIVDRT